MSAAQHGCAVACGPIPLTATTNVYIQGAPVNIDGTYTPAAPYILEPTGSQLTCYVPALSAVLIQLS